MQPTYSHSVPRFLRRLATLLCLFISGTIVPGFAAEAAKRSYDLPADVAEKTLKLFSEQSGRGLLASTEIVKGIRTNAVRGDFTAGDALSQMLADTGLVAAEDAKNGAFVVKKEKSLPNAQRVAQTEATTPKDQVKVEEGKVVLDTYEVTGSRMKLNSGEKPSQPVLTYTSKDIERLGASSLAQLFQYIPSVTSSTSGLAIEGVNGNSALAGFVGQSSTRTSAQLRGGAESATLLLVDGKRVPRTGQRNGGGVGFDLGGIPLSAIDRVEVLLDGASAIYGNDAINGVINVILKKSYSGTEIRLTYDNTFDKDAAVRTASLTHGFAQEKWSGLVTFSASDNNAMMLTDRRLTESYNRKPLGGILDRSQSALVAWEGNGSLSVASGVLPGIGERFVSIPTRSSGTNLTLTDFQNAPPVKFGTTPDGVGATSVTSSQSAYARIGYEFSPQLEISAMLRYGRSETSNLGVYRRAFNITLPATYPGNPFGVPVRLSKVFYDLPKLINRYEVENGEFGLSAKGKLPHDWHYEASLNYVRGTNDNFPPRLADGQFALSSPVQALVNTAIAAGRTPALIYDSQTQSPNAPGVLDEFFVASPGNVFGLSDLSQTWTYAAQADGPLFSLPAGEVRAVAGVEYREEYIATPHLIVSSTNVWNPFPERKVKAGFAEVRIPLVASKQHWPLVQQLDLNLAVRSEGYSDIKGGQVLTPRYGLAWRPISSLLLRGSYGEGFLVPNLYQTLPVQTTSNVLITNSAAWIDPLRGNTIAVGQSYINYGGGNPGLRPQTSQNWTYGAVLEVPKVKGLSVSFDYFDNRYEDRFGGVGLLSDRVLYAPETIVRGPNLPTDPAGWAGPVVSIVNRTINVAESRVSGYNFGVRWNRTTPWGELSVMSSGERILGDVQKLVPNAVPQESVNKKFDPMRITTSLYWSRGPWDAGVTNIYGGRYWVDTNDATLAPSRWTDDVLRFDANASYDFGKNKSFGARGDSWWKRALHDTKVSLTIINVANTEPPLDVLGFFSSSVIDPRLRRYVIDFTKRF